MLLRSPRALLGAATLVASFATPLLAQTPRVRVGPEVLVSHDADVAHAELWLSAHPTDPNRLVGMSTVVRDVGGKVMTEVYATKDGGYTWTGSTPARSMMGGGGDPITGWTRSGVALASDLGEHGMWIYRSEDGGFNWGPAIRAGHGDHQRLATDFSNGRYGGRLYIAAEATAAGARSANPDTINRAVFLWRSLDDGKSWLGPVRVALEPMNGIAVDGLQVMSDGTVALFMKKYPNPSRDMKTPTWEMQLATSTDGGETFSTPRAIGKQYFSGYADLRRRQGLGRSDLPAGGFAVAVDTKSAKFRDRLYTIYVETRAPNEGGRLVASYSADHGRTWSAPKDIVPETRAVVSQYQPAVAANKDGTVGVLYYDTRDANGRDEYNAYFIASTDGGVTWTAPTRLSTMSSVAYAPGNVRPVAFQITPAASGISVTTLSGYSRWSNAGDYMGMAADAGGTFHPFWSDARTGTFQIYTSRVDVLTGSAVTQAGHTPAALEKRSLNTLVTLEVDPISVDWEKAELLFPVRLRNTSSDTLYGPLTVELTRLASKPLPGDTAVQAQVVNAPNGLRGKGARFDYSASLRDTQGLPPGGVTEPIVWRIKPATLRHPDVSFVVDVQGNVAATKAK